MAVQSWKRRLACEWSILTLFPSLEEAELWGKKYRSKGYMWTLTFPDEEGRSVASVAQARFRKFCRWARSEKMIFVWSFERGKKSGDFHYHMATPQRWSAKELWSVVARYGIGNIDVQEKPYEDLKYLAKYVGKHRPVWPMPKRARLWGCHGFKGVKTNDIKFSEKTLTIVSDCLEYPYRRFCTWESEGVILHRTRRGTQDIPGAEYRDYTMNVTKENVLHIGQLLASGKILAVGEYRTMKTRELRFTDETTKQTKLRKIVEHGIEVGDLQLTVTEWLPDDADISNVKRPAEKGEPVCVEVSQFSKKYGITAASIKSLASMNGKLA